MQVKRKLSLVLCLFLTFAPFLGSWISNEKTGDFWGTYFPYIHLSISQIGGFPFAEAIDALFALLIFIIGLVGFLIFIFSSLKKVSGLIFFLYLTITYCIFRAIGALIFNMYLSWLDNYSIPILFLISAMLSDFMWALLCWWASKALGFYKQ